MDERLKAYFCLTDKFCETCGKPLYYFGEEYICCKSEKCSKCGKMLKKGDVDEQRQSKTKVRKVRRPS